VKYSEWFNGHFLEYAPSVRPLLLLLDGHSSHYGPQFIRLACEKGIIVFCLPPHGTHICQPLDASCFHSLKTYWDEACDKYMSSNPGHIVTIYQFSQLFATAWKKAMIPSTIVGGFKTTGIFPLNRHAIVLPGEQPGHSNTPTALLAKKKGIQYMPFYSASPSALEQFTAEEQVLFAKRFDEGYDLANDERYNQWLKVHRRSVSVQLFAESDEQSANHTPCSSISDNMIGICPAATVIGVRPS